MVAARGIGRGSRKEGGGREGRERGGWESSRQREYIRETEYSTVIAREEFREAFGGAVESESKLGIVV